LIEKPKRDQAKEYLELGTSYEMVARKLEMSERTIRRWDKEWGIRQTGRKPMVRPQIDVWPESRRWNKETHGAKLNGLNLPDETKLTHESIVTAARINKNKWLEWYETAWVDFMTNHKDDRDLLTIDTRSSGRHWVDGLAGLPVLCAWLGGSDICSEMIDKALIFRPWQSNPLDRKTAAVKGRGERIAKAAATRFLPRAQARIKYGAAVRQQSQEIKKLIGQQLVIRSMSMNEKGSKIVSPNEPLMGLMDRIPMFDMERRRSSYRKYSVWDLHIGIFMFDPLGESQ